MKQLFFTLVLLISLSSCERGTYYFDKFAGSSYQTEMMGKTVSFVFRGNEIDVFCEGYWKQTIVQDMGSNAPDLYVMGLNNIIFNVYETPDGNLQGWYYTYGNNPNTDKTDIILYKCL